MNTKEKIVSVQEDKKPKKEKCIHEGHRARLTELAYNAGLENISPIQVVEFFLGYVFPRGDLNPLAHRLLDRFEAFPFIVEANIEDLKRVHGINTRSAKMIHMFSELFYYFSESKMGKKFVVKTLYDLADVAEDHLRFRNTEHALILALSPANVITHKRRITFDSQSEVGISLIELSTFLASAKPTSIFLAHCHPYGRAKPSKKDLVAFQRIEEFCISCGVNLIDNQILGEDGVWSWRRKEMLRQYSDLSELKDALIGLVNSQE